MLGNDYFRSDCDNYVYSRELLDDLFVYLLLYIDNMLIASKNIYEINGLEN
jgi:ATP-binding cassette subfamily B (MDR/TAP) protein 1